MDLPFLQHSTAVLRAWYQVRISLSRAHSAALLRSGASPKVTHQVLRRGARPFPPTAPTHPPLARGTLGTRWGQEQPGRTALNGLSTMWSDCSLAPRTPAESLISGEVSPVGLRARTDG